MKLLNRNTFAARCEILRDGGVIGTPMAQSAPEIVCDTDSDLVLSMRGSFYLDQDYNFFTDRLRPVVTVNGTDYPLGVYVVTTEDRSEEDGRRIAVLEGYSLLYLARRKKIESRLHISAGTNYITEITNLLSLAGIDALEADATTYTFATDREDWDIGTSVLEIVNTLLAEISYKNGSVGHRAAAQIRAAHTVRRRACVYRGRGQRHRAGIQNHG